MGTTVPFELRLLPVQELTQILKEHGAVQVHVGPKASRLDVVATVLKGGARRAV